MFQCLRYHEHQEKPLQDLKLLIGFPVTHMDVSTRASPVRREYPLIDIDVATQIE